MPNDGYSDYPPEFVENCFASFEGELNGFAGPHEDQSPYGTIHSPMMAPGGGSKGQGGPAGPGTGDLRVVVDGTRSPRPRETLPGLREQMVAAAVLRIADQLPRDAAQHRTRLRAAAHDLLAAGAEKAVRYGRKPRKK